MNKFNNINTVLKRHGYFIEKSKQIYIVYKKREKNDFRIYARKINKLRVLQVNDLDDIETQYNREGMYKNITKSHTFYDMRYTIKEINRHNKINDILNELLND